MHPIHVHNYDMLIKRALKMFNDKEILTLLIWSFHHTVYMYWIVILYSMNLYT
jgi:hypothetical protein